MPRLARPSSAARRETRRRHPESQSPKRRRNRRAGPPEPPATTFLEALGDALVADIRTRGEPYVSVVTAVPLDTWRVPATLAFDEIECPAVPAGAARARPRVKSDVTQITFALSHIDARGASAVRDTPYQRADGGAYPNYGLSSDFVVHERIFANWENGARVRPRAQQFARAEAQLAALLPRLRDAPHASIVVGYTIEKHAPGSRSLRHVSVDLCSRFAADAPKHCVTQNAGLLAQPLSS